MIDSQVFRSILARVEQPARYSGGEFGSIDPPETPAVRIAICFPDLYEIGMSNLAVKLLYRYLNAIPGVACERVFMPADDFATELKVRNLPLCTIESRTPLHHCDIVAFSVGYELLATNVLAVLELGGIPRRTVDRGHTDPIVLAGGPGITNPVPFGRFFDGVFVGEAEAGFLALVESLVALRLHKADRPQLLRVIQEHDAVWHAGRRSPTRKAVWTAFHDPFRLADAGFPVPSIRVAQDHGVVEIMRGCPQGCRFCHAGVFYRPYRQKTFETIEREVASLVDRYGYREITLSSLSSGDYAEIAELVRRLNLRFAPQGVHFQLPSLRVNSFTLPLLDELGVVRKAGLTFAVESADDGSQRSVNKLVELPNTVEIIRQAYARGWRKAKFYFMIGLPSAQADEVEGIIAYMHALHKAAPIRYTVNVATFVPKPHTPFQWDAQLDPAVALDRLQRLQVALRPLGMRVDYHDPYVSMVEGVITRGDERTADTIEAAYDAGAKLDAWSEHFQRNVWLRAIEVTNAAHVMESKPIGSPLPWDTVYLGVTRAHTKRERQRAENAELTNGCAPDCDHPCGVCNRTVRVVEHPRVAETAGEPTGSQAEKESLQDRNDQEPARALRQGRRHFVLLEYDTDIKAAFLPHLAVIRVFERMVLRSGLPIELTKGFHPKPDMSFAQPLNLGVPGRGNVVLIELQKSIQLETFWHSCVTGLPSGIRLKRMHVICRPDDARAVPKPMDLFSAADYLIGTDEETAGLIGKYAAEQGWLFIDSVEGAVSAVAQRSELRIRWLLSSGASVPRALRSQAWFDPVQVTIERTALWARAADGGEKLVPYEHVFQPWIEASFPRVAP